MPFCLTSRFAAVLFAAGVMTLSGCTWFTDDKTTDTAAATSEKTPINAAQFSGYLTSSSELSESSTASGGTRLGWVHPSLKGGQYHALIIDPIGFYPKPPLYSKVSKGRMLEVVQYLTKQARQEIGRDLAIVTQPGPGVLRLDAAITSAPATVNAPAQSLNLPVAGIFTDIAPNAVPPQHGRVVYLEARLLDSQSQAVLAKTVRAATGSPMADPAARITLAQMQPVLDNWAKDAGVFLRENIKPAPAAIAKAKP